MNQTTGSYWLLTITSPENLMPLETAIDGLCAPDALSTEIDSRNNHKLQIWFHDAPDSNFIEEIAARALSQQNRQISSWSLCLNMTGWQKTEKVFRRLLSAVSGYMAAMSPRLLPKPCYRF